MRAGSIPLCQTLSWRTIPRRPFVRVPPPLRIWILRAPLRASSSAPSLDHINVSIRSMLMESQDFCSLGEPLRCALPRDTGHRGRVLLCRPAAASLHQWRMHTSLSSTLPLLSAIGALSAVFQTGGAQWNEFCERYKSLFGTTARARELSWRARFVRFDAGLV